MNTCQLVMWRLNYFHVINWWIVADDIFIIASVLCFFFFVNAVCYELSNIFNYTNQLRKKSRCQYIVATFVHARYELYLCFFRLPIVISNQYWKYHLFSPLPFWWCNLGEKSLSKSFGAILYCNSERDFNMESLSGNFMQTSNFIWVSSRVFTTTHTSNNKKKLIMYLQLNTNLGHSKSQITHVNLLAIDECFRVEFTQWSTVPSLKSNKIDVNHFPLLYRTVYDHCRSKSTSLVTIFRCTQIVPCVSEWECDCVCTLANNQLIISLLLFSHYKRMRV